MKIILSDNTEIEILAVNFDTVSFDWRRTTDYRGACSSKLEIINFDTLETDMKLVLEEDLNNASIK